MAKVNEDAALGVLLISLIWGIGAAGVSSIWLSLLPAFGLGLLGFVFMFFFTAIIAGSPN